MGERLRETARQVGLTSDAIAEKLGVQGGSVRGWWRGRNEPAFEKLKAYADLVGVSISYLMFGSEKPMGPAGTLREWRIRFADLIAAGVDPAEAIDQISGEMPESEVGGIPVDALTREERELLTGQGIKLKSELDRLADGHWLDLTMQQKEAILRLVETMARENQRLRGSPPDPPEPAAR
jgi:transcriptional regulator with XRE-family HTH domain